MAAPVAIVTDSTCSIPKEYLEKYTIRVIPQILIWEEETLLDGIDIQVTDFYNRLAQSNSNPTTSQATIASFKKVFDEVLEEGYDILAILISQKLSGTIESANQAKALLPDAPIEIVDSNSISMAMGFQILSVAHAASEGASLNECKQLAEKAIPHTGVAIAVDTLEYLHRGGRIGGGARFLGTALNIKPILEVVDGRVEPVERVRTRKKSLSRLVDLIAERVGDRKPVRLAGLHANAPEDARGLLEMAVGRLDPVEQVFTEVSPVVGAHAGPGTVGLAYMAGI
ncbi:MAG: DegV family protein [Anaerolineales bacterium]